MPAGQPVPENLAGVAVPEGEAPPETEDPPKPEDLAPTSPPLATE